MANMVANGVRFNVQRLGSPGPAGTIVCLHGLLLDNLSSFYYTLANPLAKEMEVVLYDQRGHGRSERPPNGYGIDDAVGDLVALLDALAPEPPLYLCGNSYGSLVALEHELRFPGRVDGLILIEAHLVLPTWGEQMAETIDLGLWTVNELAAADDDRGRVRADRKLQRQMADAREMVATTSLVHDLRFAPLTSLASLEEVECPVLALYGERSDVAHVGRLLAESMPTCELRVVADSGHSLLMESPARVLSELRSWLAELADQRRTCDGPLLDRRPPARRPHQPDPVGGPAAP
ncbi:MAG: putative hydrolase or acyltransferase of alpha/beta superfamily [Acidimicrobiales bacterium]|nr:putative hydrolase or acyltransferase of alpha/beta superfamily [Acidimicrobiales bacterium]